MIRDHLHSETTDKRKRILERRTHGAASFQRIQRSASLNRPTVLIVTDHGNEQFDQIACALQRRGVRVLRVRNQQGARTTAAGRRARTRWLRDHWFYDACCTLSAGHADLFQERALRGATILDVLVNEPTLAAAGLSSSSLAHVASRGLAYSGLPPSVILDKYAVNEILHASGIRTPAQYDAAQLSPAEALARLGLPLIVKDRVGAAGNRVRLASTPREVELALQELGSGDLGRLFYQQYVEGEMVMYGAVVSDHGPVLEQGLKAVTAQWPLGPSARVALLDDGDLLAAGRAVTAALGCRGFAEIGFVRDRALRLWHIDANCRCWGNMISLLQVGIDFTDAYVSLLNKVPHPGSARRAGTVSADVLPFSLYAAIQNGDRADISRAISALMEICRRGPGWRYGVVISIKTIWLLAARAAKALMRRRAGSPRQR